MTLQRNNPLPRTRPIQRHRHQHTAVDASARDQSWPGTLMVFGIFVVVISFWWVGTRTLVSYMELARWFALFAFVGNLLPYQWVGLRMGMERLEWFLFNLLAVGPFVFSGLLWLNLLVHGPQQFAIIQSDISLEFVRNYWMVNGELPPSEPLHLLPGEAPDPSEQYGSVGGHVIGTARGVLGYEVITTYEPYGLRTH